jgi:peptide methionine sulfoxide reductase MsrB
MLSEQEYDYIHALWYQCVQAKSKLNRRDRDSEEKVRGVFRPFNEAYFSLTGEPGIYPCFTLYHRRADFGPLCSQCGKPLRTPRAKFCAGCGQVSGIQPITGAV